MSAYPVTYEADYVEKRNRLSVFFRLVLVIPHAIVAYLVIIGVFFTGIAAWFVVVATARYPQGLYDFNAKATRWLARYYAYAYLEVDKFPPLGFDDSVAYPVNMRFAGPLPQYSRLKAFFRFLLIIPAVIILYALSIVLFFCTLAAWFVAVITGKMPRGLHDALDFCLAYTFKACAYCLLLTETYPPFTNESATLEPVDRPEALSATSGAFAPPASAPVRDRSGLEG